MGNDVSHHESVARGPDARMVDRMVFFSDAVFAIVLTIMVLELHPPVLSDSDTDAALWNGLAHMGRTFFAFVVSFLIVGVWWSVHMRVTRTLKSFDWPTAIFNFLFLFTVTLVPFATSVLGEGVGSPAAWEIYWGVNAACSVTMTLLVFVMTRGRGKFVGGMSGRERAGRLIQSIGPGIGFAAGVYLASSGDVALSRQCWLLILPIMALARVVGGKRPKPAEAAA
ncbi:MAG TPA: TMEM175 family protein [Caulobacterales bacterium]|nr:TMEM175 family protein [Caulobacterales bacterium]